MNVTVVGAGVAGLCCALSLLERGVEVEVLERAESLQRSCSWYAGGMLAPSCEAEHADFPLVTWGLESIAWWRAHLGVPQAGTLVVAHRRDAGELQHFAKTRPDAQWLDTMALALLEPDLAERFERALFFPDEAHLDPREAMRRLQNEIAARGGAIRFGVDAHEEPATSLRIDCRGLAARDVWADLRGVKGEMVLMRSHEISLRRPVRLLHPRMPVYIVPRGEGLFMIGATSLESDDESHIHASAVVELLSAACAVHPAFAAAHVEEIGTHVRPAYADHRPRLRRLGRTLHVNGLYRHGFLLAPAIAARATQALLNDAYFPELMHEDLDQWRAG